MRQKKGAKNSPKKVKNKTCLSKGTGSALIFQVLHVSSERLPHRPKTSIAPLARSLRSLARSARHGIPVHSR